MDLLRVLGLTSRSMQRRRLMSVISVRRLHSGAKLGACQTVVQTPHPERVVLVSNSTSIYDNLALEAWLYDHANVDNRDYLLMWRNTPAVVIGRHQNPWLEADVKQLGQEKVDLARRQSGGGAVYHDLGNLNCSFLTARKFYNRRRNLELVVRALSETWDIDLSVNSRDDILLDGLYKVSGTASKLGRLRAYHHFTLLLDVDRGRLQRLLQAPSLGVDTRATQSVAASTLNLRDVEPGISYDSAVTAIAHLFLQFPPSTSQEGSIQHVNPMDEAAYPGVEKLREDLCNPEWIFGKSPKFATSRIFAKTLADGSGISMAITCVIVKGRIETLDYQLSSAFSPPPAWEAFASHVRGGLLGLPVWGDSVSRCLERSEMLSAGDLKGEFHQWLIQSFRECLLV